MTIEEIKKAFSRNLKHYMSVSGKTQSELVQELSFRQATVSDWINGKKYPRMDKIEILAKYFGISVADLISEPPQNGYYNNPETAKLVQELYDNPDRRVLLDATRNLRPEDVKALTLIINQMTKKESSD